MEDIKKIPVLRFPEFSGEWEGKKFKQLVKLQRGSSPRPIVRFITKSDDGVNWIKIGDTKSSDLYINSTADKITKKGAEKSRKVNVGEIILSNSMSYGKPYILNIDGYIHDGWFVIRDYEKNFNKVYLLQLLGSELVQKQYKRLAAGGVVSNISSELVNSVKINLPSKQEQTKIAGFVTKIDKKIEELSKKKQLLDRYKKGVMQNIFSQELRFKDDEGKDYPDWEEKKLVEIATFHRGANLSKSDLVDNGNTECVHYGELFTMYDEIIKSVTSSTNNKEGVKSKSGDILMPSSDVTPQGLGRASALMKDDVLLGGDINIVRSNKDIDSIFLSYLINYDKNKIIRLVTGTTVKHIYTKDLKTISINLPSLIEEQTKIANFLTEIDNKINLVEKQLTDSKQYKKSLLQQMFV